MALFNPAAVHTQLEEILAVIKEGDAEQAYARTTALISTLERIEGRAPGSDESNREPEPWRLVAAHLKSAEFEIRETHLALAQERLEQAIGVVLDGGTLDGSLTSAEDR